MTRKYPTADVKMLYGRAAARCAFTDCRVDLVLNKTKNDKNKQIGEIAHIVAHSPAGPRAESSYENIDSYDNWILLCPTHHKQVDTHRHTYPTTFLRELKIEHEKWVTECLDEEMSAVGFAELEVAAKAVSNSKVVDKSDFIVIPPKEKMQKNGLTDHSHHLIVMGLSRSSEVKEFIVKIAQIDSDFPERLKGEFKKKYLELKENLHGDALFEAMFEFAKGGNNDFKIQAAGLAILCHLFEICEVFEK